MPLDGDRCATEIADHEPLDINPAPVELHIDIGPPCLDARERSPAELERDRALARQLEGSVGKHPLR